MRSAARRHPLTTYLVLVYAATVAVFALPFLSNSGLGIIDLDLPGVAPFVLLLAIWLAVAAFITAALTDGRDGVRELRRRVFNLRVHPGWYVLALFLLPATALATAVALSGPGPIGELLGKPDLLLTGVVLAALVAFLLVNWWEEAGWTGFVLDRLQPRIGPVAASVVTTWLQATVHLPLVFVADGVTVGRVPADQVPFYLVALFVLPIAVRLVITWLYNATGRSVPVVGLYHAGLGVASGTAVIPVIAPEFAAGLVYAGFAVLAAAVLIATRGHLGYVATGDATAASWRLGEAQPGA
ncbi:MAG: CPBP family glutamic-type intramembrane protease [Chloroflexota bacterium]